MIRPSDTQVFARAFVDRYGEDCIDRIGTFAPALGLVIKEVDAEEFEGALLRMKDCFQGTLLLGRGIVDEGRRRFTLAHELGHYVLPGHGKDEGYCRGKKLDSWGKTLSRFEREANEFAGEVLMPMPRIQDLLGEEPSYEIASDISRRCASSLSASAYRLAELTTHRFCVVWSEGSIVRWSKNSAEFDFRVRYDDCDTETFACRCFDKQPVPDNYDIVPASAWLYGDNLKEGATILEHSRYLPSYDAVITFLLVPDIIEVQSKFGDLWE